MLDVVAEHPEEQQVAEQVLGVRVQEHRGEEREVHVLVRIVARPALLAARGVVALDERLVVLALGERATLHDLARDRRVVGDEPKLFTGVAAEFGSQEVLPREMRGLNGEEHHDAQGHQRDRHPWEPTDRGLVGNGDHATPPGGGGFVTAATGWTAA